MLWLENQKHGRLIKYRGVDVYKTGNFKSSFLLVAHSKESSRMGSEDGSLSR